MAMILRLAVPSPGYRMGVVKTDQPLANRSMKGQRVVQTMRLFRRHRNPRDHEADPMTTIRIYNEHLPVKVEKHIEGRIAHWP